MPGLLRVGALPVCTFDTLFRMLGRGVLTLDPTASPRGPLLRTHRGLEGLSA